MTDDERLEQLFGHVLRTHVKHQDVRKTNAPRFVFADADYEVGDGKCGLHEDAKSANEPAIVYVRVDALVDEVDANAREIARLTRERDEARAAATLPADREALAEVVKCLLRSWLLDDVLGSYDIDAEDARNDPEFSEAVKAQARAVVDALTPYILAPGMVAVPVPDLCWHQFEDGITLGYAGDERIAQQAAAMIAAAKESGR